jgi:hypothetical protein
MLNGAIGHRLSGNCRALVRALESNCCVLKHLHLQETALGRTGLTWLFEALQANVTLEKVCVLKVDNDAENANPSLRDGAKLGAAIATVLKNPASKLHTLCLSAVKLRLSDAEAVFTALSDDRANLASLSLQNDHLMQRDSDRDEVQSVLSDEVQSVLSDEVQSALIRLKCMLQNNVSLKFLSLSGMGMNDGCLLKFAGGLSANSTLLEFEIKNSGFDITLEGIEKFWRRVGDANCCCDVDFGPVTREMSANAENANDLFSRNQNDQEDREEMKLEFQRFLSSLSAGRGVSAYQIAQSARRNSRNRQRAEVLEDIRRKLCCIRN